MARILGAARKIIEAKGAATMTVSEVADAAGVSSSSIYQYYSNKSDIIAALVEDALEKQTDNHKDILNPAPYSLLHLGQMLVDILDSYFEFLTKDPAVRDIWAAFSADKLIQNNVNRDDIRNRDLIFEACRHLFPATREHEVKRKLLILVKFGSAAVDLAVQQEDAEARSILGEAKEMLYAAYEVSMLPLGRAAQRLAGEQS